MGLRNLQRARNKKEDAPKEEQAEAPAEPVTEQPAVEEETATE